MNLKNMGVTLMLLTSSYAMATEEIIVYRSSTCSCCGQWLEHIKQHNFAIKDIVTDDVQTIKKKYNIGASLTSCHTAIINQYVIEGHVHAIDIEKLLKTNPKNIIGLTVPGMPIGTPGMEMGSKKQAYDVFSFDANGKMDIFSHHSGN